MRIRDAFLNSLHALEPALWLATLAVFLYALLREGKWDWHSGPHLAALVMAFAIAVTAKLVHELRKRFHAGIFHFTNHRCPEKDGLYLDQVTKTYLYVGQSFATTLPEFKKRRGRRGMAADAKIHLLLADPDDPNTLEFLAQTHCPPLDRFAMKKEQCRRIVRTLEYVSQLGGMVEVRTHKEKLRCWLHLIDGKTMVFGLIPYGSSGEVAPALILEPVKHRWTLFDHFNDWADMLWKSGQQRDLKQWMTELKSRI